MNLLLLGGESLKNREWIKTVNDEFKPHFKKTYFQEYSHWQDNTPRINLDVEVEKLKNNLNNFEPMIVFAKSAGSILAIKASAEGIIKPKACLFVGFPVFLASSLPVDKWLEITSFKITIIQHTQDPAGPYVKTKNYLDNINRANLEIKELDGDTHSYHELEYFKALLQEIKE